MSLFDKLAGEVLGAVMHSEGGHQALLQALGQFIDSPAIGGLSGLISIFETRGLGGVIASWIGQGANQTISAGQLQQILGSDIVQQFAGRFGLSADVISEQISKLLPELIDRITPHGQVPAGQSVAQLLAQAG